MYVNISYLCTTILDRFLNCSKFQTFFIFFFTLFQTFFSLKHIFHSPVHHNAGPLPALGVHLEGVLDVVVRVAVVPHHVRLQLILREKHLNIGA